MNGASICVTKQFSFGLDDLGQSLREKSVRIGQSDIRTGNRHLDEVFVKINGERVYLWGAVDHEGVVPECFVTQRHNKATAKKFIIKTMQNTDHPRSS